jgi:hypothetical protein
MGRSMHHDTTTLARYLPDLTKDKVHLGLTKINSSKIGYIALIRLRLRRSRNLVI